ncbi:conserved hypothetical protein, unlikely [Trypanosoma brucei gambiense DAL972]|uniref:Uncharacterized protein n=1 Tax=Trypanosoma brucei gambiense (strain MHOM/CI/86/DAL972) TaxID=679716 RepID=C9ZXE5_TRYB9|nr:conserved hypothetical protein, unlikely [Trypanosoma brucei gambiense DAL972]CBH14089.1 conserved hypothetical protein, unlikely [Trypanosoma brucei gambiense DAL972]|eukprot:XP_011776360.1 conserved hypothetical protein, unlikely [Trypanosoma brucei gambiense DAL972]
MTLWFEPHLTKTAHPFVQHISLFTIFLSIHAPFMEARAKEECPPTTNLSISHDQQNKCDVSAATISCEVKKFEEFIKITACEAADLRTFPYMAKVKVGALNQTRY